MIDQKLGIAIFQNPEFADLAGKLMYERDQARHERDQARALARELMPILKPEQKHSVQFREKLLEEHPWLQEVC